MYIILDPGLPFKTKSEKRRKLKIRKGIFLVTQNFAGEKKKVRDEKDERVKGCKRKGMKSTKNVKIKNEKGFKRERIKSTKDLKIKNEKYERMKECIRKYVN